MSVRAVIYYNDGTTETRVMDGGWDALCLWMMRNHGKYYAINANLLMKEEQSMDTVHVTRCSDCVHCRFDSPDDDIGTCRNLQVQVSRMWFCADGKETE